jgi:hypothetical protein
VTRRAASYYFRAHAGSRSKRSLIGIYRGMAAQVSAIIAIPAENYARKNAEEAEQYSVYNTRVKRGLSVAGT